MLCTAPTGRVFVTICKVPKTGVAGAGDAGLGAGLGLGDGIGAVCGPVVLLGAVADFGDAKPVQPARQSNARGRIIAHRITTRAEGRPPLTCALAARRRWFLA